MPFDLDRHFPGLQRTQWERTSPEDKFYNCIAWAANDTDKWWWPIPTTSYWPPEAPRELTVSAFIQAFQALQYDPCDNGDLEPGFEKVVIYINAGNEPTHMARQLPDGRWTSKLGRWEDIAHALDGVAGEPKPYAPYGRVAQFMRRLRVQG